MKIGSRKLISRSGTLVARVFGFGLVLTACSTTGWAVPHLPEMDPGLTASAMALLSCGLLMIAGRRRRP